MIVTTPTDKWLRNALQQCGVSFEFSSPYIGSYLVQIASQLDPGVSIKVLTRTSLPDFATGASNLESVISLADRAGGVLSLRTLHAKVYVVDEKKALVTSANATFSGMKRNWECGVEIIKRSEVQKLSKLICKGFGSIEQPRLWSLGDLQALRQPVEVLQSAMPKSTKAGAADLGDLQKIVLRSSELHDLTMSLPGWLRLTFEGVSKIRSAIFTAQNVYDACMPLAIAAYPNNKHIKQKLRQQLQRLRDLGMVSFLGKGRYQMQVGRR